MKKFNLNNQEFFPTFGGLPEDHALDNRYYEKPDADGGFGPIKHWCLLGEIIEAIPHFRPTFKVKDKADKVFTVACYFDSDQTRPSWMKFAVPGHTISVMYADKHFFMDGQLGIRLEDIERVNVYSCSLKAFMELPSNTGKLRSSKNCRECQEYAGNRCSICKVRYCDRDCQKVDWAHRHKMECVAIADIARWKKLEWGTFDNQYWC